MGELASPQHAPHVDGSRRLWAVCIPDVAKALLFGLLPLPLIANGHSFFVQQLQRQSGVWPLAVHATYQFEDQADCAFGKRERFREWGLWLDEAAPPPPPAAADAPRLGGMGGGGIGGGGIGGGGGVGGGPAAAPTLGAMGAGAAERFLVLRDEGPLAAAAAWVGQADPHVRGRQHVAHLTAFRQRLAAGVALARLLNRTVVLPRFWCHCDPLQPIPPQRRTPPHLSLPPSLPHPTPFPRQVLL